MTAHPIHAIAYQIDPGRLEYGRDHERTARAHDAARRSLRALADAKLPHCFTHGGVRIAVDPQWIGMVRSMLLDVAGHE